MSSLATNLNSSTAQEIVNWVTTADACVHTADATRRRRCVLGIRGLSICSVVHGVACSLNRYEDLYRPQHAEIWTDSWATGVGRNAIVDRSNHYPLHGPSANRISCRLDGCVTGQ